MTIVSRRIIVAGGEYTNKLQLLLDGVNDNLSVASGSSAPINFLHQTGVFTIAVWLSLGGYPQSGSRFVMANSNTGAGIGFSFRYSTTLSRYQLLIGNGSSNILNYTIPYTINTTDKHLVVLTGDGVRVYAYVDGVFVGSSSAFSGSFNTGNSINSLNIGNNSAGSGYFWSAYKDVSTWPVFFTQTDVDALSISGKPANLLVHPKSGSLALWARFGDGYDITVPTKKDAADTTGTYSDTNIIYDMSGNGHHLTPGATIDNSQFISFV